MHFFDLINEDLFRPLTGIHKRLNIDILNLIWHKCRRMPMYAIEKGTIIDEIESYVLGLEENAIDSSEDEELADISNCRAVATIFIRRLKNTGWLEMKDGNYGEEERIAINYKIVPIIRGFEEVINPKLITYRGKLFKIFTLLNTINQQDSPYETVLKEVSEDIGELNQSLRQLAASIEEHIDELTRGRGPEEILSLFEKYEEKIVVGAYHRFKTNDNLFYYRTGLYEQLEECKQETLSALVKDYMNVERVDEADAKYEVLKLIRKVNDDVIEMENIMREIDDKHIIYRTRAVQRAQFQLLSDGSVKSKINGMLQYYATLIGEMEDINEVDESLASKAFQIYGQNYFGVGSLATPNKKRKTTPIQLMSEIEELDLEMVEVEKQKLLNYAKSALTSANVNTFANKLLKENRAISAGSIFIKDQSVIVKIIGLYTFSKAEDRVFEIILKDTYVEHTGIRFKDFTIEKRLV